MNKLLKKVFHLNKIVEKINEKLNLEELKRHKKNICMKNNNKELNEEKIKENIVKEFFELKKYTNEFVYLVQERKKYEEFYNKQKDNNNNNKIESEKTPQ